MNTTSMSALIGIFYQFWFQFSISWKIITGIFVTANWWKKIWLKLFSLLSHSSLHFKNEKKSLWLIKKFFWNFFSCAPAWEDPRNSGYTWFLMMFGFFLPLAVIVYTSLHVVYNLHLVRKQKRLLFQVLTTIKQIHIFIVKSGIRRRIRLNQFSQLIFQILVAPSLLFY